MPKPLSSSYGRTTSASNITTNDVAWDGPDLPCIELCKGDLISDVMYKIAKKLCDFIDTFDLTDFDLKCLLEACDACPDPEKNVVNILKLLRDGYCDLKEKVDNLDPSNEDSCKCFLDVNMRCLAITDGSGEILNNNSEKAIIQSIIDQVCITKSDVALQQNQINDLQEQIDNLNLTPTVVLPSVASECLFSSTRPLDEAHAALDSDYCAFKEIMGTGAEINQAISNFCDIPEIKADPNYFAAVNNMARFINNIALAFCNLRNRVIAIETTCCAPNCDNIKIGFIPVIDYDNRLIDLQFTAGAGTVIPLGFVDCGSTIVLTDTQGNKTTVITSGTNIIANDSTVNDINAASFIPGRIKASINSKFCLKDTTGATILVCTQCYQQEFDYNQGCCEIKNEGTTPVTVVFQTCK